MYVSGNYTQSLTIATDNDIIINGNITTTTTGGTRHRARRARQLLGLVANDFVRVYHPSAPHRIILQRVRMPRVR